MALIDEFDDSIGRIIKKGLWFVIDVLVFGAIVLVLWNYLSPILGIVKIDYKAAVAMFLLSRFLLKDHLLSSEAIIVNCGCEPAPSKVSDESN